MAEVIAFIGLTLAMFFLLGVIQKIFERL